MAPTFENVPPDVTIICDELPDTPDVTASDESRISSLDYTEEISEGDTEYEYIITRTWTAVDHCGNVGVAIQTILYIPESDLSCEIIPPPVIICNTHDNVFTGGVTGGYGPYSYHWEISRGDCQIQSGQGTNTILVYVGFYDVTLTLTVTDSEGCVTVCTYEIDCLDKSELNLNAELVTKRSSSGFSLLSLTPIPTFSELNMRIEASHDSEVLSYITTPLGNEVMISKLSLSRGVNEINISLNDLKSGIYILNLIGSENRISRKILKID